MKTSMKAVLAAFAFFTVIAGAWSVQAADGVIRHHHHQPQPPMYPMYTSSWMSLNGAWDSIEPKYEPNVQLSGRVIFNLRSDGYNGARGEYQLISNCAYYDGTTLQTTTRTSVYADDYSVRVLESVQSSTQQGPKYCTASIPVQVFQYQVENNVLIMYTNTGKYYFQRAASY